MSKAVFDTLIEVSPAEVRAARVDDDGVLYELLIDRVSAPGLVGGVYAGRVKRVEKGMDAAFVDIGTGELALLNRAKGIAEGKNLIVQVTRDARDGKGPAVTMRPALLGRYLGYTPGRQGLNWSRAVGKGRDRNRLEEELPPLLDGEEGFSVRGPAVLADAALLQQEIDQLRSRWDAVLQAHKADKTPRRLEAPADLVETLMRDAEAEARFAVDDRAVFARMEKLAAKCMPDLAGGLLFQSGDRPIFEEAEVEEQIEDAVGRTVTLPGGGTVAFDSTEAMQVVDVNMGAGTKQGEDAVFQVNCRAAEEVARQIMLRNLSGLVVIDFISMKNKGRMKKLLEILKARFRHDLRHTDVLGLTAGGLIEITRQREGVPLADLLVRRRPAVLEVDPLAQGCAILRAAIRMRGAGRPTAYGSPDVIEALRGPLSDGMEEAARRLGQNLTLRVGMDNTPPDVRTE